eukprot:jgi/Botrbrau1/21454/Bobra.0216s0062.1
MEMSLSPPHLGPSQEVAGPGLQVAVASSRTPTPWSSCSSCGAGRVGKVRLRYELAGGARKAKEAIGGIAQLQFQGGRRLTINVEYNQLDPLLRATVNPEGDVNDDTGFSLTPGNINQLVMKMSSYVEALERTGGIIAEFVNPKYTDETRTAFKSSTRLECMMQDFPHELPEDARVGFTVINQVWAAYSPVKNSPRRC